MARLQRTLLDGIHLPNLMRSMGTAPSRSGFASGRRGRLLRLLESSLQSSFVGQIRKVGVPVFQLGKDVSSAPGWVLLVQEQGLLHRCRRSRRDRSMIRRLQRRLPVVAELLAQSPHGSRRETKFEGDVSRFAALLNTLQDFLPQSQR